MNDSKKTMTIIAVIIAIVAIWYFFFKDKKKPVESSFMAMNRMVSIRKPIQPQQMTSQECWNSGGHTRCVSGTNPEKCYCQYDNDLKTLHDIKD